MNKPYTLEQALLAMQQPVTLSEETRLHMQKSVDFLTKYMENSPNPVYGVNTGFGSLQNVVISNKELSALQENLLITHAAGVGQRVKPSIVKKMMWLKLLNMSKGHSAIRPVVFERLAWMFNQSDSCIPEVTEQGSLGASGDLAPLAQMALPIIGKGYVWQGDTRISALEWLNNNGLEPITLAPKEALALINGTQFMLAYALEAYEHILEIQEKLTPISGASIDGFDCRLEPFHEAIHRVRPHAGQIKVAEDIREVLKDSQIAKSTKSQVQDPYSFRCIPQVHGASVDALEYCFKTWEIELNSVTDNPNVFEEDGVVVSGGNFHGQPLALTLDYAAMAISELANISERRIYLLVSGQRRLTPYLASDAGVDSGYMIAQYTAASLVSQNKQYCTPASIDSIVSSNGQEDHVSMGANAATKLHKVIENTKNVLAIEWVCAVAALNQRSAKSSIKIDYMKTMFMEKYPLDHQKIPMQELINSSYRFLWG